MCIFKTPAYEYTHSEMSELIVENCNLSSRDDIINVLADSTESFVTIKESIQNILEKLKLRESDDLALKPHRNEGNFTVGQHNRVLDINLGLRCGEAWANDDAGDLTLDDNNRSYDVLLSNNVLIYEKKLINECTNFDSPASLNKWLSDGDSTVIEESQDDIDVENISPQLIQPSRVSMRTRWRCKCPSTCVCSSTKNPLKSKSSVSSSSATTTKLISRKKYKAGSTLTGNGHLKLSAYTNSGLITIHIQKCRKLYSRHAALCDTFVKVEVLPRDPYGPKFRTIRVHKSNHPHFDEKFSFELCPDVKEKRIYVSVWYRNNVERCNDILGCMSFGISNIAKKAIIEGWYHLLTENVGKFKHYAVSRTSTLNKQTC